LGTILGDTHPLSAAYRDFWNCYISEFKSHMHYEIDTRKVIKPVHILCSIQLVVFKWFTSKKLRRTPAEPQFQDILDRLSLQIYSNPTLPPPLYQLINPRPFPGGTKTITTGTAVTDESSTVSALTNATGITGTARTTMSQFGNPITNPNQDPALQALLPTAVRVKDLLGQDEAPRNEANSPMCLSYHLRGVCSSTCRRKVDHDRALTQADKTLLSNWIVDQLAKRRAAGAILP
jgi:hypothetical protein